MSVIHVNDTTTPIITNSQTPLTLQNSGNHDTYISDNPNLTPTPDYIKIIPGTVFAWPAGQTLYAICPTGTSTTIAFLGISIGSIGPQNPITIVPAVAQYVIAATANTLYKSNYTFTPGVYTITCPHHHSYPHRIL